MYKSKFVYKNRLRQKEPNGYTKEIISYEQLSKTLVFFFNHKNFKKTILYNQPTFLPFVSHPFPEQNCTINKYCIDPSLADFVVFYLTLQLAKKKNFAMV